MTSSRLAALALAFGCLLGSAAAFAAEPARCGSADSLQIRGDVPAAISFDVYPATAAVERAAHRAVPGGRRGETPA